MRPPEPSERFITSDKILYHPDLLARWRHGRRVVPLTMEIHPTDRCNQQCTYCHYPRQNDSLSPRQYGILLRKLRAIGTRALIFSGGGEPLLNPHLPSFLTKAVRAGRDVALITNLTVCSPSLYRTICRTCTWVRISLDAATDRTYRAIRGTDTFDAVLRNIARLLAVRRTGSYRATIGLQMVVSPGNITEIAALAKRAVTLGVDYLQIRPLERLPTEASPYRRRHLEELSRQVQQARRIARGRCEVIFSNKWDLLLPPRKHLSHGFSFCHAYQFIGAIDARGDYYVCCHKVETRDARFRYGNIVTEPIERLLAKRPGRMKHLALSECYLECRGSAINRRLEGLLRGREHVNFL